MAKVKCEPAFTQFDKVNVRDARKLTVNGAEVETINPDHFTAPVQASYDSPNSFSMNGNQTQDFQIGRRVQLDSGQSDINCNISPSDLTPDDIFTANKYDYSIITAVSYDGVITDVTIADSIVTAKLEEASVDINWSETQAGLITTTDLINSTKGYPSDYVLETSGFYSSGDGGGAKWVQNGVIAQTPSQNPKQLSDSIINDANGNQWELIKNNSVKSNQVGVFGSNDSASDIVFFISLGGDLIFDDGDYVIAESGAGNGSATATIDKSVNINCSINAVFSAGLNLDDDMIRIKCDELNYTPDRVIEISWIGGRFDQTKQKNSTSVPNIGDYPPQNPGTTATANCLAIDGEISYMGTPTQGFDLFRARNAYFKASDTGHWESAGGDTGLGCNALKIDVESCEFIGQRDAGTYPSGLSAGTVYGASGDISKNIFRGCWAGVTAKRNFNHLTMKDNKGFNSATVVSSSMVTGGTISGEICGNIGYNAWRVVNANGARDLNIHNNHSHNHGHLLENNIVPTTVFNNTNACVYMSGSQKCNASFNSVYTREPLYTTLQSYVIWLANNGSDDSNDNLIESNSAFESYSVINEVNGNNNKFRFNFGITLNIAPVNLTGADSVNFDRKTITNDSDLITISGGKINAESSFLVLDSEGGAPTDSLDTIDGGNNGQRLILQSRLSSRDITIKDGTGNMELSGDFTLSNISDTIELIYRGDTGFWYELTRSDNKT